MCVCYVHFTQQIVYHLNKRQNTKNKQNTSIMNMKAVGVIATYRICHYFSFTRILVNLVLLQKRVRRLKNVNHLKMLVRIHSLFPPHPLFWGYQKLSHIQKALCVKFYVQSRRSLGEISKILFSNCLKIRFPIFTWMIY